MKRSLVLLSLIMVGCAAHRGSAPQAKAPVPALSSDRVIVKLVGRDTTLIARATRSGPTYSLETNKGEILVPGQTLDSLRVQRPDLAREVQTLTASAWAGL